MRCRLPLAIFSVFVMSLAALAAPSRLIDRELARLAADPRSASTQRSFQFIVLGDSCLPSQYAWPLRLGTMKPFQADVFKQIIHEANILQPAFLVDVGDLILGYDLPKLIQAEWDDFVNAVAVSQRPFLCVAGNHDVFATFSEHMWRDRIGPLRYSFDYGNSHFIVLNSQDSISHGSGEGVIAQEQRDWLNADLAAHRSAANVFVFLHQPFWVTASYPKGNWTTLHAILKQYPVRVVFAGHLHRYQEYPAKDGIYYVATGSGGQEVNGSYLVVTVDGTMVRWAVNKKGAILSADLPATAKPRPPAASHQ